MMPITEFLTGTALTEFVAEYGYLAIFLMMFLEGMCIPIPSELTMGFAGFMVYQGKLSLPAAIFSGWLGSFSGSFMIYALARKGGGRKFLYRWGYLIRLTPYRLDKLGNWFNHYGPPLIIPWRQLPIIRTKISIAAGLFDMRYITFISFTAIGNSHLVHFIDLSRLLFRSKLGKNSFQFSPKSGTTSP